MSTGVGCQSFFFGGSGFSFSEISGTIISSKELVLDSSSDPGPTQSAGRLPAIFLRVIYGHKKVHKGQLVIAMQLSVKIKKIPISTLTAPCRMGILK